MTIGSSPSQRVEPLAAAAEAAVDALVAAGDGATADALLEAALRRVNDDALTLRRAERALVQGDALAALETTVPAWEAGSVDPQLEAVLATAALALDLDDVVDALTRPPCPTPAHAAARVVLAARRGEAIGIDGATGAALLWALRSLLQTLGAAGRRDDVEPVRDLLRATGLAPAADALRELPTAPRPARTPAGPPLARDVFRAAWPAPAGHAAFSWAWVAARDVLADERVLLLGRHPAALRALLDHARVTAIAPAHGPGADVVARPDRLPVGTARFDHVIAAAWLQDTYDPVGALTTAARALTHGGFLHLLAWGPGPDAPADAGLRLSLDALIEVCGRAGLVLEGVDARDAVGAAVEPHEATVLVIAARRHIV